MALRQNILGWIEPLPRPLRWFVVLLLCFVPTMVFSTPIYLALDSLIGGLGLTPFVLRNLALGIIFGGGGIYTAIQLIYAARDDRQRTVRLLGTTAVTIQTFFRVGFFLGWFLPVLTRYVALKFGWF